MGIVPALWLVVHRKASSVSCKSVFQNRLRLKMDFGVREEYEDDDILPDTNIDRERTTTGRWAIAMFVIAAAFTTVAFVTPNWIEADPRFYGTDVERAGLWVHCLRSLPDVNDLRHQRYFAGCRWLFNPFTEGYDQMRNILAPPFFVATQFFYTLSLICMLIAVTFVVMYLLCVDEYYRVNVLRWTGIDLIVGGAFGTVALIIFGALGDGRDFMPDWEHNYLSWSFGLAFVGAVFDYVAGVLFIVEARIIRRKEIAREKQYPMEQRV